MPNHVTNKLEIIGNEKEVLDVLLFIKKDNEGIILEKTEDATEIRTIDFNKITPTPAHIYQGAVGAEEERIYGVENCWNFWNRQNWGTKWKCDTFTTEKVVH